MKHRNKINLQLFAMKNLDTLKEKKVEIMQRLNKAIKDGDESSFEQAFTDLSDNIQQAVMEEAKGLVQAADINVLVSRGVRSLTSYESQYYEKVIAAMKSSNPRQALTELDVVMPKTVVDSVFEDLQKNHPLLSLINFQNTSGLVEFLVNTNGVELATWGTLTAEITKELSSGFAKVNLGLNKLSAFLPVAKSMLDLGPAWLDKYVRTILAEAIAYGLEKGIVDGTGKNQPIGMNRQVGEGVTVTDGVHPLKETVTVVSLDPVTYGALIANMAAAPNGKTRVVTRVLMVVNPVDYLQKVFPATTIRAADGTFAKDVFPFPTDVVQSTQIAQGKAIIGLANRYFMGIGTAQSGKIEYSDEYHFLEDERVYLVKLYGHGEPLDNTAFTYADISGLKPAVQEVSVKGTVSTKASV